MIEILEIEQRCKPHWVSVADPTDFVVRSGGSAEPDLLVRSPHLTPYCLDDTQRRVLFVETPAEVDIAAYPLHRGGRPARRRLRAGEEHLPPSRPAPMDGLHYACFWWGQG